MWSYLELFGAIWSDFEPFRTRELEGFGANRRILVIWIDFERVGAIRS